MVAGLDANGKEVRHQVTQGAAFFFKPGTQVATTAARSKASRTI